MSDITYPAICRRQHSELELGGTDGYLIIAAKSSMTVSLLKDSAKFISLYIDQDLKIDSVYYNGIPAKFHRRKDLRHLGILLPEWQQVGDTLDLAIWYHGRNYPFPYPAVTNRSNFAHSLTIKAPASYSYAFPGCDKPAIKSEGFKIFEIPANKNISFPTYVAFLTGYDTLKTATSWGLPVYFIRPKSDLYDVLSNQKLRDTLLQALEFMYSHFGAPGGVTELVVLSGSPLSLQTGLVTVSYSRGRDELGGFGLLAGLAIASQWFGGNTEFLSYRDDWLPEAIAEYMAMIFVQSKVGDKEFFANLDAHRLTVFQILGRKEDLPLASGVESWASKGVWLLHMLRNLMNSADSIQDRNFFAMLKDLFVVARDGPMGNTKFIAICEEYFGYDLDWFFRKWLFGTGVPDYDVSYATEQLNDGYYLNINVKTSKVDNDFLMPIILRIDHADGSSFRNLFVSSKYENYKLGPFDKLIKKLHFNGYYSVLSTWRVEQLR